jgi:hypothetical protein
MKEVPIMRKKLIALSVALLTIGGSLTFASVARADGLTSQSRTYLLAAAGERSAVFFGSGALSPNPITLTNSNNGTYWYDANNDLGEGLGFSPDPVVYLWLADLCKQPDSSPWYRQCPGALDDGTSRLGWQSVGGYRVGSLYFGNWEEVPITKEVWQSDVAPSNAPTYYPSGIQKNISVSTIANGGWTLCYQANFEDAFEVGDIESACTGDYILMASGYYIGQEPTPTLTLPPDFLTPKTYGNPASVTGTAPAAPATPITPTAPVITASATSVIYNGVPQSATYSVDQKSSCTTTYNGSSIPPVQAGSYAVSITCSANSLSSSATSTLTITKATPVISWSTPSAITSSTKLGASQLSAFSYIPGSFTYSASAGSTLPIGDDLITATFTPTDTTNYTSATMTVTIKVTA